ncbi:D-amino-acid transaminase [Fulvimarina sp. 2208YS6-2-32]|uniref:Probable branched-chain-amino-acid aminotransferase n=1 Tax=Fulvimarina uroteuthidis TaxID=3098149 RepID=A0ABU5I276_9HYPH|nr:D-amino-acid transaminase [Fulvimarina sp. 2208YS6-2-32]MDY8109471.1 D-amino-acid transaminase [Fulvimarina sp. 2208YS6-2-32]
MSRTVYVNGSYVAQEEAKISVFDRGFLFADGVYEVTAVLGGKLVDFAPHMQRLRRSLSELALPSPAGDEEILSIHRELTERNRLVEGLIYLQVTRGAAERDFAYPPEDTKPSLVLFTQAKTLRETPASKTGIAVATVPDLRWKRCDIKTVQLLYPSMAKMAAKAKGADDAWMVDEDGFVTEGTSNNAYIVTGQGKLVTRHLSHDILHGITRAAVIQLAEAEGIDVEIRPFSVEEARQAREAFVTSASGFVMPVVSIDGETIGTGTPGTFSRRLRAVYIAEAEKSAI